MATTIRLHHDRHFDLLRAEDIETSDVTPTGVTFDVETRDGVETRERVEVAAPNSITTIELPDGYEATPQALLHLVQTLTERHSAETDIVGVSGQDAQIVARLAALLNAEVREFETEAVPTETSEPVAAAATTGA
jgi:hypothetical protein